MTHCGDAESILVSHTEGIGLSEAIQDGIARVRLIADCNEVADAAIPLVNDVSNMRVYYGVDTTGVGNGVNAYIPGELMTAANWLNVYTAKITLTFTNPLANQPGQAGAPAIAFTRVVGVMGKI